MADRLSECDPASLTDYCRRIKVFAPGEWKFAGVSPGRSGSADDVASTASMISWASAEAFSRAGRVSHSERTVRLITRDKHYSATEIRIFQEHVKRDASSRCDPLTTATLPGRTRGLKPATGPWWCTFSRRSSTNDGGSHPALRRHGPRCLRRRVRNQFGRGGWSCQVKQSQLALLGSFRGLRG